MMKSQTTKNTVSLLAGTGIGALAIYLLDPRAGAERRERLKQAAGSAAKGTQEALFSTWDTARGKASQLGHAASTGTSNIGSSLTEAGHLVSERIGELSKRASRRFAKGKGRLSEYMSKKDIAAQAKEVSEETGGRLQKLLRGGARRSGMQSPVNQTFLALGCIALGMGIMYIIDPSAGKRRRVLARDKVRSSLGGVSSNVQKTSRDMWNRTTGLVTELRHRASHRAVPDSTLVERIRSEMGHVISGASSIHISANNGRVTVSGPIEASEVDSLLKCVWSVPGVVELISQLDVHQPAAAISDLPGEQTSSASHS